MYEKVTKDFIAKRARVIDDVMYNNNNANMRERYLHRHGDDFYVYEGNTSGFFKIHEGQCMSTAVNLLLDT